jgi:hypothetical protein
MDRSGGLQLEAARGRDEEAGTKQRKAMAEKQLRAGRKSK